jgi:hypothetical protein
MKKQIKTIDMFSFINGFEWKVWLLVFGLVIFIGFGIFLLEKLSPFSSINTRDKLINQTLIHYNLKESLWATFSGFTLSGNDSSPNPFSTRVLLLGFYFFSSILVSSYQANLSAYLTVNRLDSPITSLQDLALQTRIKYSFVAGTRVQSYFEDMKSIETEFYQYWIKSNLIEKSTYENWINNSKLFEYFSSSENQYYQMRNMSSFFGSIDNYDHTFWEYPLGKTYNKLLQRIKKYGYFNTTAEIVNKVLASNDAEPFAAIMSHPSALYETIIHCDLEIIGREFSARPCNCLIYSF